MNWKVPKIWKGGDAWIIGGGPSIAKQFKIPNDLVAKVCKGELEPNIYSPYMESIHDKHVIGVNIAYLLGDWVDFVFFGDSSFFLHNQFKLAEFPNIRVSCSPIVQKYEWIKFLQKDRRHGVGLTSNPATISWNGNSGAAAISLAVSTGVKRIFLLGFDMKLDDQFAQHWHGKYRKDPTAPYAENRKNLPFRRHLSGFPAIERDANLMGISIFNVNTDSAIINFPKITLQEALKL